MEEVLAGLRTIEKNPQQHKSGGLRISSLGKPPLLQALAKVGCLKEPKFSLKQQHVFWTGHKNEDLIIQILRDHNHSVTYEQHEVTYHGIKGHIDFIVDDEYLVDVKTMCDSYYKGFLKNQDNSRGYITQISCYWAADGIPDTVKSAWFFCINKDTSDMAVVEVTPLMKYQALEKVNVVIPALIECKTIEDAVERFDPPEPTKEVFQKQETGRLIPNWLMVREGLADAFYEMETKQNGYHKLTKYITKLRPMNETVKLLKYMMS